ncbi:MAG: ABC transporter permease [Candidatus Latescibacterota bacterium]|nr:ABC transporter permease [Candidatus Latescibacterota bacterium]
MPAAVIIRRFGLFLVVVWAASTVNFFVPRLGTGRDPIREKLGQLMASGGLRQEGLEEMVAAYQAKFGLDQPLIVQYGNFLVDMVQLDFGYSLANYPARVSTMIGNALPWTLGLLVVATIMGFVIGTLLGALIAWPRSPRWLKGMGVPLMTLSAVPFYLLGLILLYFLGLKFGLFPLSGGYAPGSLARWSVKFAFEVLHHSVLPALSIVISAVGLWGMGMRGMMVSTVGEDYISLAEANGLRNRTIFFRFALRNAFLPQFTALGLSLGYVVTGQVLVEVVFAYPGIGNLLFQAIQSSDYTVINGIVFFTILSIGLITMAMDLFYPLLDPRITHHRGAAS